MDEEPLAALSSPIEECDARAAVEALLADAEFRASDRHRRFLRYIVDEFFAGRSDRVKAYTIAIDVFGRPASFNPASDPIVRVEAARLRAALAQYYEGAGERAQLRIDLEKGNYIPLFWSRDCSQPSVETTSASINRVTHTLKNREVAAAIAKAKRRRFAVGIGGTAAMAGALYLSVADRFQWQPVLSAKPTIVVDVSAASGAAGEVQRKAGDYLVQALSQFSGVRTLAQMPTTKVAAESTTDGPASGSMARQEESTGYKLSVAYRADVEEQQVSWQVVDAQSKELLGAGTTKAGSGIGNERGVQEKLMARLARSLAGEEGVIVSLEAARQLMKPSIGYGCVLLADIGLARVDPEGLASARNCLERSVTYQAAATYPDVLASLAMVLVATGEASSSPTVAARAVRLADKAVALAPKSSKSYVAQMQARFLSGDTEAAFLSGRRAAALNPLDDAVAARLGLLLFVSGRYSEGVRLARVAEAACEYLHHDAALTLALEDYRNGKYNEALARAQQLANPADTAVNILRAAAEGQLGVRRGEPMGRHGLRWNKNDESGAIESELAARGYAPDLIARLQQGLGNAGARLPPRH